MMYRKNPRRFISIVLTFILSALLSGCGSYGPRSMDRDQLDYGDSIGNNWKNQMLANIVKIRFVDMPVFVDVGSIVSGYSLTTTVNGELDFVGGVTGSNRQLLGASGSYTDRPTVTYTPKTGDSYLRAILFPVEPTGLLALIQAGYSADLLLTWGVESINGVRNWSSFGRTYRSADPEFSEFIMLMNEFQDRGFAGFELHSDPKLGESITFNLARHAVGGDLLEKRRRALQIIGLDENRDQYRVIFAPFKADSKTLAIRTRSVMQMLAAMAGFVDVPAEKASFAPPGYGGALKSSPPFEVRSGPDRPKDSFAEVKYQGDWYWIENSDLTSKRVFTLMLFITTLTNKATDANAPVLTIPTG